MKITPGINEKHICADPINISIMMMIITYFIDLCGKIVA